MVYPDGTGRVGKKFVSDGLDAVRKIESARIKFDGHEIVIFADELFFDGAGLGKWLRRINNSQQKMAIAILELEKKVRQLQRGGG